MYRLTKINVSVLLTLYLLALLALVASAVVATVQPETGLRWDVHSGSVIDVAPVGPAGQAGIRAGDQILAVDGLVPEALSDITNGRRAGELLSLTAQRGRETYDFVLILQQPPPLVVLERLIPLVVGFGFGFIGLSTFLLARCQPPSGLYAGLCLVVAGVLATGTLSTFQIPLASRTFNTCLALVSALNLHFHLCFPRLWSGQAKRWVLVSAYALAGSFGLFYLLPGWTTWRWASWYPALGWVLRLALGISLVGQVALVITASYGDNSHARRRHTRLLVAGAVLGLAPFLLMALLPDLLTNHPWWSYQYTFPFLLTVPLAYGYTLIRARLSHWDRIAARLMSTTASAILLSGVYWLAMQSLRVEPVHWLPPILALLGGLALWPLSIIARRWTDRVLFGIRFDYTSVISTLNEQMTQALDRSTLRRVLVEQLPGMVPFQGAALLLARDDEGELLHVEPPSTLEMEAPSALPAKGALACALVRQEAPVAVNELQAMLADDTLAPSEADWLEKTEVETWLPLAREGKLLGILLLGPRPGGDLLGGHDRRVLRSVAHEAALAAENVRLADALRASRAELAHAHGQFILAREAERRQLGWSLHDGPIQSLTAISHRLAALGTEGEEHAPELAELRRAVIEQIHILRGVYRGLRPGTLDELGLREALRSLIVGCEDAHGLSISFAAWEGIDHLSDDIALTLFRVAQGALSNVTRHSGAQRAWVQITDDMEGIVLTIRDDGQGFRVPRRFSALAYDGHFGLLGMAERLELFGGRLEVHSDTGKGTTVQAWLPIPAQKGGDCE